MPGIKAHDSYADAVVKLACIGTYYPEKIV